MRNIMVNIPNPGDATSFYRGMGPLAEMRRLEPMLNLSFTNEWNWATINMSDGVLMQRPFQNGHLTIAQITKAQNKPLWVDYDDDLFNVPTDNPAHSLYLDENIKKNIAKIIALADVVTVTTPKLKEQFEKGTRPLNKNIQVIPNAFDEKMFWYREEGNALASRNKVVMWRGSITHTRDVMSYAQQIIETSKEKKFSEWVWRFIGDNLWFVTDYMNQKQVVWSKSIDPIEYHQHIYDIAPSIIIVPLHESDFNKSKSNIAWIEGTFAGALCIAPDWEEWRRPGVITYTDQKSFGDVLTGALTGRYDIAHQVDQSWQYIKKELTLEKWAKARIQILRDIHVL